MRGKTRAADARKSSQGFVHIYAYVSCAAAWGFGALEIYSARCYVNIYGFLVLRYVAAYRGGVCQQG